MYKFENNGFLFPYIRFFNASPQRGSMDFYIGNTLVAAGIRFGTFTNYMKTGTGTQCYKITRAGQKEDVIQKLVIEQNVGEVYSICVAGKPTETGIYKFGEPKDSENADYGHVRVCNLCPQNDGFDIYAGKECVLQDIKFGEGSRYMDIVPGSYEISVRKKENTVLNCGAIAFETGKFNTVYIIGLEDEIPYLSAIVSTDAGSYNGFYL